MSFKLQARWKPKEVLGWFTPKARRKDSFLNGQPANWKEVARSFRDQSLWYMCVATTDEEGGRVYDDAILHKCLGNAKFQWLPRRSSICRFLINRKFSKNSRSRVVTITSMKIWPPTGLLQAEWIIHTEKTFNRSSTGRSHPEAFWLVFYRP